MPERPATMATFCFADLTVDQTTEFEANISEKMVADFAQLSGDTNPLHMDEAYASKTPFSGRIAHGMLGASFFSELIGMHLPGKYSLYLSQQLFFREPIRPGAKLVVRGTVTQMTPSARTIKIKTEILDQATKKILIDGEALVKLLE